ncbi:MAG TPA: hypothetical protein VFL76_03940 [Edaphocola sp.]|nr:hypothetical protein [Edaphocola sp.]
MIQQPFSQLRAIGTNDKNWFCEPWAFNCWVLDPIVIHGEQRQALSQVADDGPSAVGELFNSDDYQYIVMLYRMTLPRSYNRRIIQSK